MQAVAKTRSNTVWGKTSIVNSGFEHLNLKTFSSLLKEATLLAFWNPSLT